VVLRNDSADSIKYDIIYSLLLILERLGVLSDGRYTFQKDAWILYKKQKEKKWNARKSEFHFFSFLKKIRALLFCYFFF